MKNNFIKATEKFNELEDWVPAPYIRKSFVCNGDTTAKITVAACGFYEAYINGVEYTKGFMAPYINNTDDYIYFDEYEVPLKKGENVIGLILGNGFHNNPGGFIWAFDKASFRGTPMVSVRLVYTDDGKTKEIVSDESFKTMPSAIKTDDYRFGVVYDANDEIVGWNMPGFDDSNWNSVLKANPPKGELKLCEAEPVVAECELKPVDIFESKGGYIYDFGQVNAGVCRLKVKGTKGQKIEFQHVDVVENGEISVESVWSMNAKQWERDKEIIQKDVYICKGEGEEVYVPSFVYHGFRYVEVKGITKEQATKDLLTYIVIHSRIESRGDFECSNEIINKLQDCTRRSDKANYHYFVTDCPQREKNGWTADAALSCEQMLINFNPENNYREWQFNICKAQAENGSIPGIVPTGGWGFAWGNGPAWDCVMIYLPYYVYLYRGRTEMIRESADSIMKYLKYLETRKDEKGLMHIGLGDWCQIGRTPILSPLEFTDSVISMDIAEKSAVIFNAVGMEKERDYAKSLAEGFKKAVRDNMIDYDTMTVAGNCQTSQAMALFYGIFEKEEEQKALKRLIDFIREYDDHMYTGVLGARVIFHVLSKFGYTDLAFKMIVRDDHPSYGNWIARGATTLWETFFVEDEKGFYKINSINHHFWGDISGWFIKCLAGINLNPYCEDVNYVEIKPCFATELDYAKAHHIAPAGKIVSKWKRENDKIILNVEIPDKMTATAILEKGYTFVDGCSEKLIKTGEYIVVKG
ncbi:MAG: family 78 glycoside hydrolase catalytic domain [Clostridia bacterium]|nr:family 78 glycoside hydrolase catalytic domain [Clostridia bacterium]